MKRSVSFPPELWDYIEKKAGRTGVPSKIVQEAIRRMMEEEPIPEEKLRKR